MKAELINPFIKASKDILMQMAMIPFELGKIYLKESPFMAQNVAILIGVTGGLKGQVIINMGEETAKKIASGMMGGMPVDSFEEIAKSAISELGNMIMGNTATLLYNEGITIDITPPTLLTGEKLSVSNGHLKTLCIPLISDGAVIEIEIAVKE
ncbi:chemotaxis protein CheX [Geosporobacter subterraneus DSM 17957]|uniref:Chemotaxis protein CheX n=1 Tax=Geosporobacter subterraneus DSM 17957 TaxID=1121919 RepID=A0A1M6G3A0_9FIRM|nr:chemotaxis protein CheX [Geosporobacter subterraneus]SHJ04419.1 chemotaxis protein CheX [Geosporobacter subterraneus DSM 17957]